MNTLFKFYMQVWGMLGLAVGASVPGIWKAVERWRGGWRWVWTLGLTVLLVGAALFCFLGTPARVRRRLPKVKDRIVLLSQSGDVKLTPDEVAMSREIEVTHEQLRELNRPVADYLYVRGLKQESEEESKETCP